MSGFAIHSSSSRQKVMHCLCKTKRLWLIWLVIMNWSKWLHTLPLDISGSRFKMNFLNSHKEHWVNFSIRFNVFVRIGIFCYDIHQEQISFTSSSGGWPSSVSDVTTTTNKSSLCSEETNAYRSLRQEYNYVSILINNKDIYILALFKFLPTLCYRSSDFFDWGGQFLLF